MLNIFSHFLCFAEVPDELDDTQGAEGSKDAEKVKNSGGATPVDRRKSRSPDKSSSKKRSHHSSHSSRRSHKSTSSKKSKSSNEAPPTASSQDVDKVSILQDQMSSMMDIIAKLAASNNASSSKRKGSTPTEVPVKKMKHVKPPSDTEDDSDKEDTDSSVASVDWANAPQPTSLRQDPLASSEKMAAKPWMFESSESEPENQGHFKRRQHYAPGMKIKDVKTPAEYSSNTNGDYIKMGCPRLRNINGVLVKSRVPDYCSVTYQGNILNI